MKPADLQPGHRITHTVPNMDGTITVEVAFDAGPHHPGQIYVDTEISDSSDSWNHHDLPTGTGAEASLWMGTLPRPRYRLVFHPDTDITVENE